MRSGFQDDRYPGRENITWNALLLRHGILTKIDNWARYCE
jgi:hypothetical protein